MTRPAPRLLDWLLLAALIALFVAPLWDLRFLTGDDAIHAFAHMNGSMDAKAAEFADGNGRIWLHPFMRLFGAVAAIQNSTLLGLVNWGVFALAFTLPALALAPLIGSAAALLWCSVAISWLVLAPHAPPPAWPAAMLYPFVLYAGVVAATRRYAVGGRAGWAILALLALAVALPAYESTVLVGLTFVATGLLLLGREPATRKRTLRLAACMLAVLALYAAIYVAWRLTHDVRYQGMQPGSHEPAAIADVFKQFGGAAIWLVRWLEPRTWLFFDSSLGEAARFHDVLRPAMLLSLPAAAWVAACIAAGLTLRSLTALRASFRGIALFLVAGAAMFIVAIALQSLTDQWQRWTSDGAFQSWLPTRYAYFGVATMVAAGLAALARVPRVGAVLGAVIIFVGALGTAAVNQPIARSMRIQSAKFEAYDTALRCATTRGWLAGQNVLAPRLFDWVDFAETQDVAFFDVWAQRRGVTLRLTQQLDARGPHASFDVRLDGDGTLLAALVAGPAPDARGMLVRRNYEGFVGWRDESGQRQMPLDTATTRCADTQFALVQLPPNALLDTVALSPLPLRAHFPIVPLYTVFWMERPTPLLGDGWNRPPDGQASWMKDDHATLWFEPMQVPANGLQLTLTMLGTAHVRVRDGEKILAEAQLTWDEQRILFDLPPGSGAMRLDLDRGEGTAGLRWLLLTNRP